MCERCEELEMYAKRALHLLEMSEDSFYEGMRQLHNALDGVVEI